MDLTKILSGGGIGDAVREAQQAFSSGVAELSKQLGQIAANELAVVSELARQNAHQTATRATLDAIDVQLERLHDRVRHLTLRVDRLCEIASAARESVDHAGE